MTIELPPLDSGPLIYFLFHSGIFVAAVATLFFLIGLMLGRVSWGKYKFRARALAIETEAQRNEIADLKRKLAEQTLRPLPAISPPPAPAPATPSPAAEPAPQDVLTMPELAGSPPLPEPLKPAATSPAPRTKPAAIATAGPARPVKNETPAIAPFSFLSEEPAAQPRAKG